MAKPDIHEVKEVHAARLLSVRGVVGVYVGELADKTPCIGVMVVRRTSALEKQIPKFLEGYPVRIEETGQVRPLK